MKKIKVVLLAVLFVGTICVSGCSSSEYSSNSASQVTSKESSIAESSFESSVRE